MPGLSSSPKDSDQRGGENRCQLNRPATSNNGWALLKKWPILILMADILTNDIELLNVYWLFAFILLWTSKGNIRRISEPEHMALQQTHLRWLTSLYFSRVAKTWTWQPLNNNNNLFQKGSEAHVKLVGLRNYALLGNMFHLPPTSTSLLTDWIFP